MKFKVLEGVHHEGGKVYKKGETVESELDLVALFVGKFQLVESSSPKSKSKSKAADDDDEDDDKKTASSSKTGGSKAADDDDEDDDKTPSRRPASPGTGSAHATSRR